MGKRFSLENVLSIGVDPHREALEVVGIRFPEEIILDETFEDTPSGHRELLAKAKQLASKHSLSPVFGLEESGNYGYNLARYLVEEGCQVKEVNPRMTNRQRDFYGQDKTDRLDALSAAAIVLRAYERLPDVTPVQEATQATKGLSRYREQLVKGQTANLNRLHSLLANQYPAYKAFFSQVNGAAALAFWATYPTPSHLKGVTIDELADFLYQRSNHRLGRGASRKKAQHILESFRWENVSEPDILTKAQAQIIKDLAQRLLQLKGSIQTIGKNLKETIPSTGQELETFNGLGTVLAAVFIGETLSTARFDRDKDKFASYNGTAPATRGSGKHTRRVENRWCNRRLKDAFNQLALSAARLEPLSEEYYQGLLERGMDPPEARKRLMRRLSDIIFAMMRDKTAYDPATYRRKKACKAREESVAAARWRHEPSAFPSLIGQVYHTREASSNSQSKRHPV
ncbi:MAG: IS110 family transposase [Dehalococcoidia bacterium]